MIDLRAKQREEQAKNQGYRRCITCYRGCDNITQKKVYCCEDLPERYITKPVRLWMCKPCARRIIRYE